MRTLIQPTELLRHLTEPHPLPAEGDDCPDYKEDNLRTTEDVEPCEKPQGAADESDLCLQRHLHVSLDHVEGRVAVKDANDFE